MTADERRARDLAVGLLARREHSRQELKAKLKARGIGPDLTDRLLEVLEYEGLQSDRRFTEAYLRARIQKGYGPVRLRQELYVRGIGDELAESCLSKLGVDWMEVLNSVRVRKFGEKPPSGYREQAKESRFLQYRGYTADQIRRLYTNGN